MKVWITRDKDFPGHEWVIYFSRDKPVNHGLYFTCSDLLCETSKYLFKKMYGFTPRKGSKKQYEISIKEIK